MEGYAKTPKKEKIKDLITFKKELAIKPSPYLPQN